MQLFYIAFKFNKFKYEKPTLIPFFTIDPNLC